MRDSLSGLSTGAMQAASAACPAFAFHSATAFVRAGGLALAGLAITAAAMTETANMWTKGTVASNQGVVSEAGGLGPSRPE